MNKQLCWLVAAAVFGLAAAAVGEEPSYFAIRNARIVPVSGPPIPNGTVVIHNGLIAAVGAAAVIPPAALVIDGKGLTVYPGLIDALSTVGLVEAAAPAAVPSRAAPPATPPTPAPAAETARPAQGPEDRPATTPWVNAADLISPSEGRIESARNAGFTTALVAPPRGIFAGYSALINLAGERAGSMVVKTPVALHLTLSTSGSFGSYPGSLMGTLAYVKQTFLDARHYRQAWAAYNGGSRGRLRPQYDRALEGLQPAASGRILVFLPAHTEVQIRRYLDLGRDLETPFLLYGAHEGYRAAELLAERKAPVLVSAKWPEKERDADPEFQDSLRTLRLRDRAPSTPAALHKAGVRFAFYSDGIASPGEVLRNVKRAIDAGLPADAALRALTLSAAEIFGVADALGSIEPGKVANLVVADGDLFNEKTKIKHVFVDGRKFGVPEEEARPEQPPAVNVTGVWTVTVQAPEGPREITATLRQQGSTVTGSLSGPMGAAEITDGSVSGNELRFRTSFTMGGRAVEANVRATVTGSSISGTVSIPDGPPMNFSGSKPQGEEQEQEGKVQ